MANRVSLRKLGRNGLLWAVTGLISSGAAPPTAINQSSPKGWVGPLTNVRVEFGDRLSAWVATATSAQVVGAYAQLFLASPEEAERIPCLPPVGDWRGNRVSSGFGVRQHPTLHTLRHHDGIDIAGPHQYVRAAASGRVIGVGYSSSLGRYVTVDHLNSYQTVYGHLALTGVQVGQWLAIGETLGITGNTGWATGVHLHYSVLKHQQPVDPADYLTLAIRFVQYYQRQRTQPH